MFYGRFTFTTELNTEAILPPFKGSTFRGAFGSALKRVVCALKRQDCDSCLLASRCVYAFFFEKKDGHPHPFLIEPPLTIKTHFEPGVPFEFNLLLFGRALDYLPYCIYAFEQVGQIGIGKRINGKRAGFVLKAVASNGNIIYTSSDRRLIKADFASKFTLQSPPAGIKCITVHLKTPLRVKHENHLKAELPFHVLIRAALRRIASLFACYGPGEPALDYKGLVKRAQAIETTESNLRWFDWQRYSNRQEVRMLLGGMVGSVSYQGDVGEFLPLLRIGEEAHLGKQTTFGLGKITIEFQKLQ